MLHPTPADEGIAAARAESSVRDLAKRFIDKHGQYLGYLRDRWQDEKQYEDWSEYEKMMRQKFSDFVILRVVKVGVVLSDGVSQVTIKATAKSFSVMAVVK